MLLKCTSLSIKSYCDRLISANDEPCEFERTTYFDVTLSNGQDTFTLVEDVTRPLAGREVETGSSYVVGREYDVQVSRK